MFTQVLLSHEEHEVKSKELYDKRLRKTILYGVYTILQIVFIFVCRFFDRTDWEE